MIGNLSPNNQITTQEGKDTEQARKESDGTSRISKNTEDVPIPQINQQEQMRLHTFLLGVLGSEIIKHQRSEEGKLHPRSSQAWSP